jgi:hypothetical protein
VLHGQGAEKIQQLDRDRGIGSHQRLDDQLLQLGRPGNGDENKENWKTEMLQPRKTADEVERAKRNQDNDQRHSPAEQSPVRIGDRDQPSGKQERRAEDCHPSR